MSRKSTIKIRTPHRPTLIRRGMLSMAAYAAVMLLMAPTVRATGDLPSSSVLEVGPDGIVACEINEQPARLQFRGDGLSYPVLNPDAPKKFKVRSNIFADALGIEARIGATTIPGHTGKAKFSFEGQRDSRRALWFDRVITVGLDGGIGPDAIPQARVTIATGNNVAITRTIYLPSHVEDNRVGTSVKIGSSDIFVMFNTLLGKL